MTARLALDRWTASDGRTLLGPALWIVRLAWVGIAGLTIVVAVAGFDAFLGGELALLESQGPLSIQPGLAQQLEFRLFDIDVLKSAQAGVHVLGMTLFAGAGGLVFWRRSGDWVVALSSITLFVAGAALFVPSKLLAASRPQWDGVVHFLGVFDAGPEFWRSAVGVAVLLFALLFPDGRFVPSWTRWAAAVFAAEVTLWVALPGVAPFDVSQWPGGLQPLWTLGLAVLAVYAQLYRYTRVSIPEARKQTRLVVISLTAIVGGFLLIWLLDPDLASNVDFGLVLVTERTQAIYDLNVLTLLTFGVILFPVSIGVSVARYRLWDVDFLVNRALVYGTTTVIIGGSLLLTGIAVGGLVENTFGRGIGIGISALLMALLFQPLRTRVQAGIDRRFYPQKYDAERTVDAFAERIRDEADLDALRLDIASTIEETLRPVTVNVSLPSSGTSREAEPRHLSDVYVHEPNRPIPISAGVLPEEAAAAFTARGIVMVVPLVGHRDPAGLLELGPKADGSSYSVLDQQLLRRLAEKAAPAIRYGELVAREAAERAARRSYERELELAEKIQRDLLPRRVPELEGWELAARYQPARQVSGDLYDFIPLPDGRLAVVIADVTDKGVPAAMVMATCRSVLRGAAAAGPASSPGEVLARVNELLVPDMPEKMFVTCFYAVLDPATGRLRFANAGQNLPLLRHGDAVTELTARGMPLGLMPGMTYEEDVVSIAPGDALLFYSDGLVEAHNPDGEMFGKPRAVERVRNHPGGAALLDYLVESLIGFAGAEGARDDDVTLVALRRRDDDSTHPEGLRVIADFSVPSERGGEIDVVRRLRGVLDPLEVTTRTVERIETAVAEATMNAMEHGNGYDPNLEVEIRVLASLDRIEVHITDQGEGAPVDDLAEPDLEAKLAGAQTPRGWGIFLIKNMVDDLRVTKIGDHRRLELVIRTKGSG